MTTSSQPSVLAIIVTWNKKTYLLELLASLSSLDYSSLEILVVDNASQDGTAAAIKNTYPHLHLLVNQENLGGTGGFNTGLQWAFAQPTGRYQYLWLLDNDVLVHRRTLSELVELLETKPDLAVAGSTMMQLDYPWRINEMGAYVHRGSGLLVLNRHLETIPTWQGRSMPELLTMEVDLSKQLLHCQPYLDVDYVAGASLLIRSEIAKQAGLWRNYFIHFDDVEWCLRIRKLGHRVVVSAKSLIWHLSAAAKVPTWVLYYDNRNILDLLTTHGADNRTLKRLIRYILLKAVYYHLIGKADLAHLHHLAVADFLAGRDGQRDLKLTCIYEKPEAILKVLLDPAIKRILVSWTINLQAMKLQEPFIQSMLKRPDLKVDFLTSPGGVETFQIPNPHFIFVSKSLLRWKTYWQLRGRYDLVFQSDYEPSLGLAWLQADLLYANDEGFCQRPPPKLSDLWKAIVSYLRSFWQPPKFSPKANR